MKLNRRHFIQKLILGSVGFATIDSYWLETNFIEWTEHDISETESNKIKAIHLTDLHLHDVKWVHKSIVGRINKERPDVLFFTGDSIERNKYMRVLEDFLSMLNADIPKIAILGNKESSGRIDLQKLKEVYGKHNGILLINKPYLLKTKKRKINIVGLDDLVHGHPDFRRSIEKIDRSSPLIVLNHCPAYREQIDLVCKEKEIRPKLILSGHTHGGQVTFFGIPLITPYGSEDYVKGWYNNGISNMYVSKGIGTTVIPLRFGARAEASIFYI